MHLVWFKRDLRIEDNAALAAAEMSGDAYLCLYVIEPDYWALPDTSARQFQFLLECLTDLRQKVRERGGDLLVRMGSVLDVFGDLKSSQDITKIYSHEETGNLWTYGRDKKVKAWAKQRGVIWQEYKQFAVIRGAYSRDGWADFWDKLMQQPSANAPLKLPAPPDSIARGDIPTGPLSFMQRDTCPGRLSGGRAHALKTLESFLSQRGERYRAHMSSPLEGEWSCSRLSPYLAMGSISMREAATAAWQAYAEARISAPRGSMWVGSIQSFIARLHWHCHFIQKLEDEPAIETRDLHPAYAQLKREPNAERLLAWAGGQTGLPFVDACMRFLIANGWLNFRMRAMVTAFASYHLWLPWQQTGQVLARRFVDYEPGIHWPQIQMQSGTTGINTPRIYNPIKQGYDQDPNGIFTRRWVPELADIPDEYLQEPWLAKEAGRAYRTGYPEPIINVKDAAKEAREKIWAIRRGSEYRGVAKAIVKKHGSRKNNDRTRQQSSRIRRKKQSDNQAKQSNQLDLF